ncbi:hypothetical protein EVAR_33021_1 [Eumeta japonica]|uniref:Uncharacterized protein n=1 Tax=Eumeta variegata TaxID=151549 RepID=A0A4C1VRH5_EUMVA|nr:hypothetical protein EVAR_33021_1 [Eumeta japonica]
MILISNNLASEERYLRCNVYYVVIELFRSALLTLGDCSCMNRQSAPCSGEEHTPGRAAVPFVTSCGGDRGRGGVRSRPT